MQKVIFGSVRKRTNNRPRKEKNNSAERDEHPYCLQHFVFGVAVLLHVSFVRVL